MVQGVSAAFLVQVAGAGLAYLLHILFARWMDAAEYGAYAYAISWAHMFALLGRLGFPSGVLRCIPQYSTQRDRARLRGVIDRSRQLTLLTGVGLATVGSIILSAIPGG